MSDLDERAAFLAAIRERPDDDTPRLVYADWLAERGDHEAERRLRYSVMAWGVIRHVPPIGEHATDDEALEAFDRLRSHPDAEILFTLAAAAFCHRPVVWNQLIDAESFKAVRSAREYADGLIGQPERESHGKAAFDMDYSSDAAKAACIVAYWGGATAAVNVAVKTPQPAEKAYRVRVYRALANLPRLPHS